MEHHFKKFIENVNKLIIQHTINYYFSYLEDCDISRDNDIYCKQYWIQQIKYKLFNIYPDIENPSHFIFSDSFNSIVIPNELFEAIVLHTNKLYLTVGFEYDIINSWYYVFPTIQDNRFLIMHYAHIYIENKLTFDMLIELIELEKQLVTLK